MGNIRILDEHVANQIAAGEVIERPASVVKELVENALDAGSTQVDVVVEDGGLQLIRVTDNGSGMAADDCEVAFFRHATSKIADGKDLFRIRTLGFRGEALPSIAAVSKVECTTSATESGLGRKAVIEGGTIKDVQEIAASRGTDMQVKELFYNTPARLKYMKTVQTELGHISDFMYRMALAHPETAFRLKHNGSTLLETIGNGDMLQSIAAIYGASVAKAMLPIRAENPDYAIEGYMSRPDLTRSNRNAMTLVMNGRTIRNYALSSAILRAYHTLLPINRFPVIAIRLTMDPSLVDVNVHPSKQEVRFSKEQELMQFVEQQLLAILRGQVLIPQASKPTPKSAVIQETMSLYRPEPPAAVSEERRQPEREQEGASAALPSSNGEEAVPAAVEGRTSGQQPDRAARNDVTVNGKQSLSVPDSNPRSSAGAVERYGTNGGSRESSAAARSSYAPSGASNRSSSSSSYTAQPSGHRPPPHMVERMIGSAASGQHAPERPAFPMLSPIGQLHGTYIVAQNEEGLFLIDQHAAHERINYEYYYEQFGKPAQASQQLLVPITMEFTSADAEVLLTKLPLLEQVGVLLESFGGSTFLVRGLPYWIPSGQEKMIVEEMADWILEEKKSVDLTKLREKAAILCSCKASIKANQSLSVAEMETLLDRLGACRNPYTCPHGRPIVVRFSTYELEKMFKRVM